VTPEAVLATSVARLRSAGLSGAKAAAVLALAGAVATGSVDLGGVEGLDDDKVITQLTSVRGIGPWTAQMFCIFDLGRLDLWPVTDLGVRRGYGLAHGLTDLPSPRELIAMGEQFRPYRSVAAWYLWRVADPFPSPLERA
jgi:3-methyladenine DNA glycosylase/8-oxoguanine DNA glycosylase